MTSKHQDQIKTSCRDCTFAVYEGETQTGCEADRIDTFRDQGYVIEAYDDEKEFYIIKRLCNISTHDKDATLQNARDKVSLAFDLFVECSNIKLDVDVQKIADQFTYDKLKVILMHNYNEASKQQRIKMYEIYKLLPDSMIASYFDYDFTLHEKVYNSNRAFHAVLDINQNVPSDIFSRINTLINDKLEKSTTCGTGGITFISNLAYKMYSMKNESVKYESNSKEVIADSKKQNLYKEIWRKKDV